jgi:hypothetical protein
MVVDLDRGCSQEERLHQIRQQAVFRDQSQNQTSVSSCVIIAACQTYILYLTLDIATNTSTIRIISPPIFRAVVVELRRVAMRHQWPGAFDDVAKVRRDRTAAVEVISNPLRNRETRHTLHLHSN